MTHSHLSSSLFCKTHNDKASGHKWSEPGGTSNKFDMGPRGFEFGRLRVQIISDVNVIYFIFSRLEMQSMD